jgi:uncharacterized protein YndB with AHSA1/START domain
MPRVQASRQLLAPREDVWAFLAEPRHLSDWWPGLAAVQPDRRGFAPGARWQVHGANRPSLFRRPSPTGTLLVLAVDPFERFAFQLTGERLDVEIRLAASAPNRTVATLSVGGPWLIGLGRSFPRAALARLHALCQTGAQL